MSNLLDLSGKIDPASFALYEALSEAAGSLGVPFFVMGATARDLIFELGYGLPSKRATLDKDFGFRVASWGEFEKLKESLLSTGQFKQDRGSSGCGTEANYSSTFYHSEKLPTP